VPGKSLERFFNARLGIAPRVYAEMVEALCDSAGIGQLVWQSALARDLPLLVPLTMLAAAITCAANLCADAGRALACRWM